VTVSSQSSIRGPVDVVDDDAGMRQLVCALLNGAGYATRPSASGAQFLEQLNGDQPALLVLDVNMPGTSGYGICRAVRERFGTSVPIIFLSGERTEPHDRVAGLLLGADDYVVKPFEPEELLARVEAVLRRTGSGTGVGARARLTPRESEVLELLAAGLVQAQIAERLVISPKTVGTHIERILSKLGVRSRAQAVAVAYRDRLLSDPVEA
jgi:DNA-binding NarL/FixJ family response regulator